MRRLDVKKLNGVHSEGRDGQLVTIAQCPACAEEGFDLTNKNHLIVYGDGGFACVLFPLDGSDAIERTEHRRRVWELAGQTKAAGQAKVSLRAFPTSTLQLLKPVRLKTKTL
jgi:hypothetical protein